MKTIQTSSTLLLIGLLSFGSCYGQKISEVEKVDQFKDDFLSKKVMYKPDNLQISIAMLTRERYPNVSCISTYPNDHMQNKSRFTGMLLNASFELLP